MKRFANKVVVVTGTASGIGRATALRLAEEGARLVCADVQGEGLEATAKECSELGAEVATRRCDISDPGDCEATVALAVERFGRLDALCNVAGILRMAHTHEAPLEDWNRILGVNLTGTFMMCKNALPHLLEAGGSIVNIASSSALKGHPWTAAYAASKGGVLALTYTLAIEYGKRGVRANAICPGSISTPMTEASGLPEDIDTKLLRRIMPLDEFRGPDKVASVVAFLASDDAAHINGEYVRVDGAALS